MRNIVRAGSACPLFAALALAITLAFTACKEKETAQEAAQEMAAQLKAEAKREAYIKANGGTFTDSRDSKTYKVGEQVWMAENLNIEMGNSKCYDNNPENCQKYGRLYDWETAMKACPSGWHLPNANEWKPIVNLAGGEEKAGKELKASSGWKDSEDGDKNGNGTDNYGFSALPGGYGNSDGGFNSVGSHGNWWSSFEKDSDYVYDGGLSYNYEGVYYSSTDKSELRSVRCIKD